MLKGVNFSFIVVAIVFILFIGVNSNFYATAQQNNEVTYGPNWETVCEGNTCQTIVYSYEKYWFNENGDYEEIDESWYDCSQGGETQFCTNEYHFNAIANANGVVSAFFNNDEFTVNLDGFLDFPINFNPTVEGSILTYEDIVPNYVDLRYQYLPRKLKEEIIIKQPIPNLPEQDFDISFAKSGNAAFDVLPSTICDANNICELINHSITDNQVTITIPVSFLNDPNTTYPVIIDPTITLNDSDNIWDGYVMEDVPTFTPPSYTRTNLPTPAILVGKPGSSKTRRGSSHWNISSIPDNSDIIDMNLSLNFKNVTCLLCISPLTMKTRHMEGDETDYSDDNTGNEHFFKDMGNGSIYNSTTFTHGFSGNINLTLSDQAKADFENALSSDDFSFGFQADQTGLKIEIYSKSYNIASKRPKLIVTYEETDIDSCRELGIVGTTYTLQNDITTNGTCFTITADNITLDGNGFSISGNGSGNGVDATGRVNLTIKNLNISNFGGGIYFNSVSNSLIFNNIANLNNQTGISLFLVSNNNIVENSTTNSNSEEGIYLVASSDNILKNNNVNSNNLAGIRLSSSSNNNVFTNNIVNSNGNFGILLTISSNNTIHNNTVNSTSNEGIRFGGDSNNNIVSNNYIGSSSNQGIHIGSSSNNIISNNNIDLNDNMGIFLAASNNSTISNNNFTNNFYGVYFHFQFHSTNNIIHNNSFSNNERGILLDNSSFNTVSSNNIFSNNDKGILSFNSNSNTLIDNNINLNNIGIFLSSSNNNLIYNNFFNNSNNAQDDSFNFWDTTLDCTGEPNIIGGNCTGGNFWHDYNGTDLDSDGVGDTDLPYNSNGNITNGGDFLPLVL